MGELSQALLADIQIHERLARAKADEERRAERKRRHRIEDLRDALRRIRSITAETTFEEVSAPLHFAFSSTVAVTFR